MKLPQLNQKGIAHILAPLLFIAIFAGIGGVILLKSHAAPVAMDSASGVLYTNGRIYSGGITMNPNGSGLIDLGLNVTDGSREQSNMSFGGKRVAYWGQDPASDSQAQAIYMGTIISDKVNNVSEIPKSSLPSGKYYPNIPVWSPDGKKIASGVSTISGQQIWVAQTNGSGGHFVPNVSAASAYTLSAYVGWVPGSEKIMYALVGGSTGTGSYNSQICTIGLGGNNNFCNKIFLPSGVTAGDYLGHAGLAVSPTGNNVALVTINGSDPTKAPSADIYTVKPNGTGLKRLTTLPAGQQVQGVVWSPNGKKIAYILTDAYSPRGNGLYVMNADGSNPQLISSDNASFHPGSLSWAHQ